MQRCVRAGACVRVVVATSGENNPWPQRAMERRWRIGESDRVRWGALRRAEAIESLARLGLPPAAVRFLLLPDQGITRLLLLGCNETLELLRAGVAEFAPTLLVLPSECDRHPDHSALAVLMRLALKERGLTGARELHYAVHPPAGFRVEDSIALSLSEAERAGKHAAILAHASQVLLSRKRFLSHASEREAFYETDASAPNPIKTAVIVHGALHLELAPCLHVTIGRRARLLIAFENRGCWSVPIPLWSGAPRMRDERTQTLIRRATVRVRRTGISIRIPLAAAHGARPASVKFESGWLLYDRAGWRRVAR